jgi:TRAP-type C4-dicarboxylate transport system permease small subunit
MAVLAVSSRLRGGAAKVCTSLAYAISIVFMTIMIVQGAGMVLRTFEQLSPAMEIPMAYVYLAIPAGCFFMLCQLLVDLYAFLTKGGNTA